MMINGDIILTRGNSSTQGSFQRLGWDCCRARQVEHQFLRYCQPIVVVQVSWPVTVRPGVEMRVGVEKGTRAERLMTWPSSSTHKYFGSGSTPNSKTPSSCCSQPFQCSLLKSRVLSCTYRYLSSRFSFNFWSVPDPVSIYRLNQSFNRSLASISSCSVLPCHGR